MLPGDPPGHEDSWGIAWFDRSGALRLVREVGSAELSPGYARAAEEAKTATTLIAHLRKASCGAVTEVNAHPFRIATLAGTDPLFLMHNGTIREPLLVRLRAAATALGRPEATSDSDTVLLAGWLAAAICGVDHQERGTALAQALSELLSWIDGEPTAAYSAINLMIATPEGLYVVRQFSRVPEYYTLYEKPLEVGGWVVASEPTDGGSDWTLLPPSLVHFYPSSANPEARAAWPISGIVMQQEEN